MAALGRDIKVFKGRLRMGFYKTEFGTMLRFIHLSPSIDIVLLKAKKKYLLQV
jgi:hypothetical protein